jgi:Tol biopolymer transport system component/DNA-binding winged helix-turn-helix (wHTH) protein
MSGISEQKVSDQNPGQATRYRFGTFELDGQTGELRRNGVKLRLQDQPFLVLRKLVEKSGALVTREELHSALWPADTFVDFDTSLNTAIKRLREALGDSADVPVYVETVPRRGYRFLVPVEVLQQAGRSAAAQPVANNAEPVVRRSRVVLAAAVLAVLGAALAVALRSPAPLPRITDSTQITFDGLSKGNLHEAAGNLYFNEQLPNGMSLVKVATAGGPPVVLDAGIPGLFLGDVSPDGSKLLLGAPVDMKNLLFRLKLMDLNSGLLQDMPGGGGNDISWTPTGKLVFARGPDIFTADVDNSQEKKLVAVPDRAFAFFLRYSPDGSRLRFSVSQRVGPTRGIWEVRADGTGLHEILTGMTDFPDRCCGEWTPDGKYYLFQTNRNGASRIWALPEQPSFWRKSAGKPVELTTVPPNFYMGAMSRDGKKLYVTGAQPRAELVRYDQAAKQFVPYLSGISAGDLESSPDGRSVVYVRYPEKTLWRANANGSGATQLTGPSLRVGLAHWSADGTRIAFSGSRPGRPWNIFLIPAGGGPAEQITNGALSDLDAAWSPDGKTLAFGQERMEGGKSTVSVQLLDLASRSLAMLPGSEGVCCPRWSPDGKYILASHASYDDLLLYEFGTGKWSVIAKDLGPIGYMAFTRDGTSIIFDTLETKDPSIYRIQLSDLKLETIVNIEDIRRYYGEFGSWSGITSDGSPLLVRDISNEEVYALDLQLP